MNRSHRPFAALFGLVICLTGCTGRGTYPVEGKVVFSDGTPARELAGFVVSMDSSELQVGANGEVQPDATFRIGTYGSDDGALPGKYRVALTPPEPTLDQPAPKPLIDPKYGDFDTSGLTVDIQAGENQLELKVERL